MILRTCFGSCWLLAAALAMPVLGQQTPAADSKPATHSVKKGSFKIELNLSGYLEARQMTPIVLRPEAWATLSAMDSVEHGTQVKQGDVLLSLDTEGIDAAITELEASQKLTELTMQQSKNETQVAEASLAADMAAAERSKVNADEDLKRFLEIEKALSEKGAKFSLKAAIDSLEYEMEELKQLEKMYKADDLTEETEEIILKRARNQVEAGNYYLEQARNLNEETLQLTLPRQEISMKEAARRNTLEFEKAKVTLPLGLDRLRLNLQKLDHDYKQSAERLAKLKRDREGMIVKAPCDGLVYLGQCQKGKWSSNAGVDGKVTRGTTLSPNMVVMTIVNARPMFLRASAGEKEVRHLKTGVIGRAVSTAYPHLSMPAKVEAVATVPTADGNFDTKVTIETGDEASVLMPGMTASVTLIGYNKADVLAVPASAVSSDEVDPRQPAQARHSVFKVGADGAQQKTEVRIGERTDDLIEILDGLAEGDTVVLQNPEKK